MLHSVYFFFFLERNLDILSITVLQLHVLIKRGLQVKARGGHQGLTFSPGKMSAWSKSRPLQEKPYCLTISVPDFL